ncbi:MAG: Xaa-Pro peptidase family protein [Spirochaetaceae bacterium]|jgi:Xaa-Pro dipeptidase|nr:Xaa-Pro peptidase family protein [Spirochaetaceae bacterium]
MTCHEARRERVYDRMAQEGVALVMFEDTEGRRDPAIRWLTGQPGDALLFLSVDKQAVLVPWDINIAKLYADADFVIPYAEFCRQNVQAILGALEFLKIPYGSRIEIPMDTSYRMFLRFVEEITNFDVLCQNGGVHEAVRELRTIKDEAEIRIYMQASAITNEIIDLLEDAVRSEKLKTETDVALFIEAEARSRGCEGMGFETLAAGPGRSFGIHAFPAYTSAAFTGPGLAILDFGLKLQGYTTDVTLTFVRGPLAKAQERLLSLTEKAYKLALSLVACGAETLTAAAAVDALFGKSGKTMPHGLGHGIGLEAHEAPFLRNRAGSARQFQAGMIFTLEPGLYDPVHGGCRLENDILLTGSGAEVLTQARIIRL